MKKNQKILVVSFSIFVLLELCFRYLLHFGSPPLYIEDPDFEYIYAPNQRVNRFGNLIQTNEFSMRSLPLKKDDSLRILKIGDSIINGGSLTSNDSLASTLLEKQLSATFEKKIRVLNIAAGSWGPDNAFAYIKKHGDFNAKFWVLVFSSHDLYDNMQHEKVVDEDPSFPSKTPLFAIGEIIERYAIPWVKEKTGLGKRNRKVNSLGISPKGNNNQINPGWHSFFSYASSHEIELLVVLHPTVQEIENKQYNSDGIKIIKMLDSAKINYVLELNNKLSPDLYRDEIHYNNKGQKKLKEELYPYLERYVQTALYHK